MLDIDSAEKSSATPESGRGFASLGIHQPILDALAALGYEEPTPIQCEAIPVLLGGRDLLGQAATGTGKTAAFAIPMLQRIFSVAAPGAAGERPKAEVRGLVLVPTRELAMQVAEAMHKYGKELGACIVPIYGGQAIQQQLRALRRGVDVVVATPGRALDHLRRGSLPLDAVHMVVLDEADEMLDMGFAEDLEAILATLPGERQTALFSATMHPRIAALAERYLSDPARITIARPGASSGELPSVRQTAYVIQRQHKIAALGRVLDMENPVSAIVFCRTRTEVDELTETLSSRGYRAEALHGGLSQEQRDRVMRRFREGTSELLVATDVAARGLDIAHVSHVINFDVPSDPEAYVHRIGRTGRAGRSGIAITLAEPREHHLLRNIERLTKQKIRLEPIPTVVDLRARRLDLTRAALREALLAGDLDHYRVVLESLGDEFDIVDIATAAIKLAHEAQGDGAAADEEIPDVNVRDRIADVRRPAGGRERRPRERGMDEPRRKEGAARAGRARSRHGHEADLIRLYVGVGRRAGVRPADLVGAIANESGIDARTIGAIDIADQFSIVEVPSEAAEDVIGALRGTTIRGKHVTVRRDRYRS